MPGKIHGNPGIFSHLQGYPDQKWGFNHEVVTTIWRPYWALIPGAAKCWWYHLQKTGPWSYYETMGRGVRARLGSAESGAKQGLYKTCVLCHGIKTAHGPVEHARPHSKSQSNDELFVAFPVLSWLFHCFSHVDTTCLRVKDFRMVSPRGTWTRKM